MSNPPSFERKLALGHEGEKLVSEWLRFCCGCGVIESYGFLSHDSEDKAPKLRFARDAFVLPDLDVCLAGKRYWLEVKTLGYSPENRRLGIRVHGIRRRHYQHYLEVGRQTGNLVHLCVLEMESGDILIAELGSLTPYPCQCGGCTGGGRCRVTNFDLVYFDRAELTVVANLRGHASFEALRARWESGGRPLRTG